MPQSFASQADLRAKKITFRKLSANCYAFTAEGDPNTGVIVGDDGVMVIDAQATPVMARAVIRRIRRVTSKPVKYVVLSHRGNQRKSHACGDLQLHRPMDRCRRS